MVDDPGETESDQEKDVPDGKVCDENITDASHILFRDDVDDESIADHADEETDTRYDHDGDLKAVQAATQGFIVDGFVDEVGETSEKGAMCAIHCDVSDGHGIFRMFSTLLKLSDPWWGKSA